MHSGNFTERPQTETHDLHPFQLRGPFITSLNPKPYAMNPEPLQAPNLLSAHISGVDWRVWVRGAFNGGPSQSLNPNATFSTLFWVLGCFWHRKRCVCVCAHVYTHMGVFRKLHVNTLYETTAGWLRRPSMKACKGFRKVTVDCANEVSQAIVPYMPRVQDSLKNSSLSFNLKHASQKFAMVFAKGTYLGKCSQRFEHARCRLQNQQRDNKFPCRLLGHPRVHSSQSNLQTRGHVV